MPGDPPPAPSPRPSPPAWRPAAPGPTESRRLRTLGAYAVLDSPAEPVFDDIARLAAAVADTPIGLVSLVDRRRQWFKAAHGLGRTEIDRDLSICAHAIRRPDDLLVVEDTRADARFAGHPLVDGEAGIRFYAGAPIVAPDGEALGTVCVLDRRPRRIGPDRRRALAGLARQVVVLLEWRRDLVVGPHDRLTDAACGLPSARAFQAGLHRHWARLAGTGVPLAVLTLRIAGLHAFEDTFGRIAANALLRDIARRAQDVLPDADPLARCDGDRFGAVLPGCDAARAARLVASLSGALSRPADVASPVAVRLGVAVTRPTADADPHLLVHHAARAERRSGAPDADPVVVVGEPGVAGG